MSEQLEFELWAEFMVSHYDVACMNQDAFSRLCRPGDVILASPTSLDYHVRRRV